MKRNMMTRMMKLFALLLAACALLASAAAEAPAAEEAAYTEDPELAARLESLPPFKFEIHKEGIGFGTCPVYSAPSEDAYRAADGKASCQTTKARVDDAGFVDGWLLVRYETNGGAWRVGYIPRKYVKGFKSQMGPHFDSIPAIATDAMTVTDNPLGHDGGFTTLEAGDAFRILSRYNYHQKDGFDWWYIECTVDGQAARGFIDCATAAFRLGAAEEE